MSQGLPRWSHTFEHLVHQFVLLCVIGVYGLGIARIVLGFYRHKPTGYLIVLCLGMTAYLLWRLSQANLKLPLIKILVVGSGVGLMLLIVVTAPQLIWLVAFVLFLILLQYAPAHRSRSSSSSSSGMTCVAGDCGDGGSDSGGGDGGCGGCGGGGGGD